MPENEYQQLSTQLADQLRDGRATIEIRTLAGPETLSVSWEKVSEFAGIESYLLVARDPQGREAAVLSYKIDKSVKPPIATVVNKEVEPPYRGKDLAQKLFALMAKDLESKGVLHVTGRIRKENTPALVSRQHVRELLTGKRYRTEHEQAPDQQQFYEVTTFLDQFSDEQGE